MAIKLIANYSKRLGLPNYSSHQFSVSVEIELNARDDIPETSAQIYQLLQTNVDEQMQKTGFVPSEDYGGNAISENPAGFIRNPDTPRSNPAANWQNNRQWKCTEKQRGLILKLVEEHKLDKSDVEALSVERFGKGVRVLNKLEASGLIDELLETHGGGSQNSGTSKRSNGAYRRGGEGRDAA